MQITNFIHTLNKKMINPKIKRVFFFCFNKYRLFLLVFIKQKKTHTDSVFFFFEFLYVFRYLNKIPSFSSSLTFFFVYFRFYASVKMKYLFKLNSNYKKKKHNILLSCNK